MLYGDREATFLKILEFGLGLWTCSVLYLVDIATKYYNLLYEDPITCLYRNTRAMSRGISKVLIPLP